MTRLVVLISGNGTNLQAILDACTSGELPAQVCAVISNQVGAYGLERARLAGVPSVVQIKAKDQSRAEYDRKLANCAAAFAPDWIILAGWMRILSAGFLERFPGKVVNLHPAMPGAFPGTHAIERAFEAWQRGEVRQTGVMVHLVPDEGVDCGPVLGQQVVAIEPEDTLETLEARIHAVEHGLLVQVLKDLIRRN